MDMKAAVLLTLSLMLGLLDSTGAIINSGFSVPVLPGSRFPPKNCRPFPTVRHALFVAIGDAFDNVRDIGYFGFRFEFSFTGVVSHGSTELSWRFDESFLNHYQFTSGQALGRALNTAEAIILEEACLTIGHDDHSDFFKIDSIAFPQCQRRSIPMCWEAPTQWGTPFPVNATGPEGGAEDACNKQGGQGVYKVINNADMYRLWRHLYKVGDGSFYWVHGFRTNKHDGFVTLDDYEEHGHFCAAFVHYGDVEFDPNHPEKLYIAQHVVSVDCHETGIKYVCDDTRFIRFINYHDDKKPKY